MSLPIYQEEKAQFVVGNAFYRPQSRIVRDLGILAAKVYRQQQGNLRILDAMAGCGVRSLRYDLESQADEILVNQSNFECKALLERNLKNAIQSGRCRVTLQDANRLFFDCYLRQDYYDVVDVDPFGSPVPFLQNSLLAVKIGGLLYLTSTDGRSLTGHLPQKSLADYGAMARSHPACHEQGLRIILGAMLQSASRINRGIEPIFSLFHGQSYRVMVRLLAKSNLTSNNYGFLGYCHQCGDYQTLLWSQLGKGNCPNCEQPKRVLSGPLWLGHLHDVTYIQQMKQLALKIPWSDCAKILTPMAEEAPFPPYFYTLGEIGRRGQMDIPKRRQLIHALQQRGYPATVATVNSQAIKTNASLKTCIFVAKHLS